MKPMTAAGSPQTLTHTAGTSVRSVTVSRLLCAILLCLLANCSSASMTPGRSGRAAAERVVKPSDFGGSVSVRVGDILVVRPPMTAAEWQVAFDASFLEFQGTPENLARPDTGGWTFHVVRAGETSLTVTPVMRGGPNPPRFTVGIHVDA
jgi:hypothetical protein